MSTLWVRQVELARQRVFEYLKQNNQWHEEEMPEALLCFDGSALAPNIGTRQPRKQQLWPRRRQLTHRRHRTRQTGRQQLWPRRRQLWFRHVHNNRSTLDGGQSAKTAAGGVLRTASIGRRGISTVETTRGFAANLLIPRHGILINNNCSGKSVPCTR